MGERYGLVLVPNKALRPEETLSTDDIIAQRQQDGWQLVSARVDSDGADVIVFRRPA